MFKLKKITLLLSTCTLSLSASAITFDDQSLLTTSYDQISTYTQEGAYIDSIAVPYSGTDSQNVRDLIFDGDNVYLFNGTFNPSLTIYDNNQNSWQEHFITGWSIINNGSYGGIDKMGDYIFLSNQSTGSGDTQTKGIVRFNLKDETSQNFAADIDPIDLTIGHDGALYALTPSGSPGGRFIHIYDPETLAETQTISLAELFGFTEHRSIAVDKQGNIYIVDWDGELHKINNNAELISTTDLCTTLDLVNCSFVDIAISASGKVAIGSSAGGLILTDSELTTFDSRSVAADPIFVSFAAVKKPQAPTPPTTPKPGSTNLLMLGLASIIKISKGINN